MAPSAVKIRVPAFCLARSAAPAFLGSDDDDESLGVIGTQILDEIRKVLLPRGDHDRRRQLFVKRCRRRTIRR